jgi:hypothetical protein
VLRPLVAVALPLALARTAPDACLAGDATETEGGEDGCARGAEDAHRAPAVGEVGQDVRGSICHGVLPSLRGRHHPVAVLVALPLDSILGTAWAEAIRKLTHFAEQENRERI